MNRNDFESSSSMELTKASEGDLEVALEGALDETEIAVDKEFFWFKSRETMETIETNPKIKDKLENLEIKNVDLEGMLERYQECIGEAVESMMEGYPELKGYVGSIKVEDLPEGVYACAGPKMKDGFCAELQLNKELFSKNNIEWKLVDSEIENFRGERWLAGSGIDGVVKHEMAHLLHLKMISDELELMPGEKDDSKFHELEKKYYYNTIAIDICRQAKENLGIENSQVARELSIYGSKDFGEFFAEAISEYQTQKKPRRLAVEVHRLYEERKEEKGRNNYDDYATK